MADDEVEPSQYLLYSSLDSSSDVELVEVAASSSDVEELLEAPAPAQRRARVLSTQDENLLSLLGRERSSSSSSSSSSASSSSPPPAPEAPNAPEPSDHDEDDQVASASSSSSEGPRADVGPAYVVEFFTPSVVPGGGTLLWQISDDDNDELMSDDENDEPRSPPLQQNEADIEVLSETSEIYSDDGDDRPRTLRFELRTGGRMGRCAQCGREKRLG